MSTSDRVALILAGAHDVSAHVVGAGLAARGHRVVSAGLAELSVARWHHVPERDGTTVELPDGRCLDDRRIGVVLHRLDALLPPAFAHATPDDRDYAAAEFSALIASWLHGLAAPVANLPAGENAWAASLHPLGWHALAAAHGLPVGDFVVASSVRGGACGGLERVGGGFPRGSDVAGWYRPGPTGGALTWVWVFGPRCVGLVDTALADRCVAFVAALGLGYAALGFAGDVLREVEPRPSFDDEAVAEACIDWLEAAL